MIRPSRFLAGTFLCLLSTGCGERQVAENAEAEAERMLVGEIAKTVLAEMRYKRIAELYPNEAGKLRFALLRHLTK